MAKKEKKPKNPKPPKEKDPAVKPLEGQPTPPPFPPGK